MRIDSQYLGHAFFQVIYGIRHRLQTCKHLTQKPGFRLFTFEYLADGTGMVNPKGVAYYNNLINGLLEAGWLL